MDEVQAAFYRLCFRVAFLEKRGTEFQDWFVKLASHAFGTDFEAVRAYGKHGDFKCDGRRLSTHTIFQCYAPYRQRAVELENKMANDCKGAYVHWGTWMKEWVLVHNDTQGLPPTSVQLLDDLRRDYPNVTIEVWTEAKLQELAAALSLSAQQALFGYAPSRTGMETLMLEDLRPVIDALERMDVVPNEEPLTPPSVEKLARNALSDDAAALLRLGRRKEAMVETWFSKSPNAELGERIAEAFRRRYGELKEHEGSPDGIFTQLQRYAGMDGQPARQSAALAVLSYFFERCDIFEDSDGAR